MERGTQGRRRSRDAQEVQGGIPLSPLQGTWAPGLEGNTKIREDSEKESQVWRTKVLWLLEHPKELLCKE